MLIESIENRFFMLARKKNLNVPTCLNLDVIYLNITFFAKISVGFTKPALQFWQRIKCVGGGC